MDVRSPCRGMCRGERTGHVCPVRYSHPARVGSRTTSPQRKGHVSDVRRSNDLGRTWGDPGLLDLVHSP